MRKGLLFLWRRWRSRSIVTHQGTFSLVLLLCNHGTITTAPSPTSQIPYLSRHGNSWNQDEGGVTAIVTVLPVLEPRCNLVKTAHKRERRGLWISSLHLQVELSLIRLEGVKRQPLYLIIPFSASAHTTLSKTMKISAFQGRNLEPLWSNHNATTYFFPPDF